MWVVFVFFVITILWKSFLNHTGVTTNDCPPPLSQVQNSKPLDMKLDLNCTG